MLLKILTPNLCVLSDLSLKLFDQDESRLGFILNNLGCCFINHFLNKLGHLILTKSNFNGNLAMSVQHFFQRLKT